MTIPFLFKNSNTTEINDVQNPRHFQMEGYRYDIRIKPKCTFWRIGLRFWAGAHTSAHSTNNRYSDRQILHIEICVGTRSNGSWQDPNVIQLQQYYIPETESTLFSSNDYERQSEVKLKRLVLV